MDRNCTKIWSKIRPQLFEFSWTWTTHARAHRRTPF